MANHSQTARTLGHEHLPVWKKGDRPGLLQPLGDDNGSEMPFLSRIEVDSTIRQDRGSPENRRRRVAVFAFVRSECLLPHAITAAQDGRNCRHGNSPRQQRPRTPHRLPPPGKNWCTPGSLVVSTTS